MLNKISKTPKNLLKATWKIFLIIRARTGKRRHWNLKLIYSRASPLKVLNTPILVKMFYCCEVTILSKVICGGMMLKDGKNQSIIITESISYRKMILS